MKKTTRGGTKDSREHPGKLKISKQTLKDLTSADVRKIKGGLLEVQTKHKVSCG